MNKVWVAIGYANRPDLTERCLEVLAENSSDVNLILVDNGCHQPVLVPNEFEQAIVLSNDENLGCLPILKQALPYPEDDDILVFMHNDVLIWEKNWDVRVRNTFYGILDLGLMGLFGAPGVALDGGRMFAKSNMQGREWGTAGELHGGITTELFPAAVIDSLCMMFRVSALRQIGIPDYWPPHHWFDRLFCLHFVDKGFKVAGIGIAFDHYGGGSSGETIDSFAQKWAKSMVGTDYQTDEANNVMYTLGAKIYLQEYGERLSLITDGDPNDWRNWNYIWRSGR